MKRRTNKIWVNPNNYKVLDSKRGMVYNEYLLIIDSLINCIRFYFECFDYHQNIEILYNQQIIQYPLISHISSIIERTCQLY
jgi:hypothetical protein